MSRQGSRVQRWLRGDTATDTAAEDREIDVVPPIPSSRGTTASPAPLSPLAELPRRSPDADRTKVQGLNSAALDLRRRQVTEQVPTQPPAPIAPPESLRAVVHLVAAELEKVDDRLDTFVHAIVSLSDGAALAARGLSEPDVSLLAHRTSRIPHGLGVPDGTLDVMALTLTTGDTVVSMRTGTEEHPATLRVTLGPTALGLALHEVQQAARDIAKIITDGT